MQSQFGPFLRQLRLTSGFSQVQVAQQAGVGRVTLNRWESGKQQPRFVEMEVVLKALGATATQIRQAARLLGTAEGRHHEIEDENMVGKRAGIGPRPNGGDLLLALRLRRGISQEDAAQKVGVATRTLRRWEKAEAWPSPEQLHALCYYLGAHEQEILALSTAGAKLESTEQKEVTSLDEIYERCQVLHHYAGDTQTEALKELGFIALESQAWPLAARSAGGRQILSRIYSCHANYYSTYDRWNEGAYYANRALDLRSPDQIPDRGTLQAAIVVARCTTYKGRKPTPERGLEILGQWLEAARWPDFRSWILSDMAKYEALDGAIGQSLELVKRSREVAAQSESLYDFHLRELDEAQILLQAGEATQTLHIVERERGALQPEHIIQFRLLEAEAALSLRDMSRASNSLQQAQQLINEWSLFHFQPRVQKVIDRI